MSWQTILLFVAAVVLGRIAFEVYNRMNPLENLSVEDLSGKKLATDDSYYLVDIRSPSEWKDTGVIKGAHLVTFTNAEAFLNEIRAKIEPEQKLAVVCRSGARSSRAARKLAKSVTWDVVDIQGGMSRIVGEGYRTVKPTRAMGCESC